MVISDLRPRPQCASSNVPTTWCLMESSVPRPGQLWMPRSQPALDIDPSKRLALIGVLLYCDYQHSWEEGQATPSSHDLQC